jgi:methionine biosynthesis protein MetW
MASVKSYYDSYWSVERPDFPLPPALEAALHRHVEPGSACLDVGCGPGRTYARALAPRAGRYVGVDVSEEAVELARASGIEADRVADASELPFDDATFDVVVCVEVMEHLFAPHEAAAEIRRVLRPGGRLVASAPNVGYWRMRLNSLMGVWNPAGDWLAVEQPWRDPHIRFFTLDAMERMLRAAGFSRVEVGASGGCLLDHATTRPTNFGTSALYGRLERRYPSLLGMTIHAVATR